MRQYLTATVQAMSQNELDDIVTPFVLKHIKEGTPDPDIRVYVIGHEGNADMNLPGIGVKTIKWMKAAVQALGQKLTLGTAVFDRHDPTTNSHSGREQIGEVVGKITKEIGERLRTFAAIHVFPKFKSRPLDIASIEAEMEFDHDGIQAWPKSINTVTGIALGKSGIDNPGFPGATLEGCVQAFAVQAFAGEGDHKMAITASEVKQAAKDLKLSPSDIFTVDDVVNDKKVRTNLQEAATRMGTERDQAREKVAKLENENAEKDKKILQHQVQSKGATVLETILTDPERKLDDKAKTFVKRNFKNFTTTAENEESFKTDMVTFVDASVTEFGELAKVFGVETTQEGNGEGNADHKLPANLLVNNTSQNRDNTNTNLNAGKKPLQKDEILRAEMDPKTNPFIPGGEAAQKTLQT